jgi:hypothetical protein
MTEKREVALRSIFAQQSIKSQDIEEDLEITDEAMGKTEASLAFRSPVKEGRAYWGLNHDAEEVLCRTVLSESQNPARKKRAPCASPWSRQARWKNGRWSTSFFLQKDKLILLCVAHIKAGMQDIANVTMSVDEELLKKARKITIDMDTNISDLFRGFLADLTSREGSRREFLADELEVLP